MDCVVDRFNLDLSLVSRLGGHSQPRTHRGSAKFPGFTITCAIQRARSAPTPQLTHCAAGTR